MRYPYLGVWLDHTHAYLFWADDGGVRDVQQAEADWPEPAERTGRMMSGGAGVYGGMAPHASPQDKRHRQARLFFEELIKSMLKAERVFIFGPGKAKVELEKQLAEHKDFSGRVMGVESADKMSEARMAAQVRDFFGLPRQAV